MGSRKLICFFSLPSVCRLCFCFTKILKLVAYLSRQPGENKYTYVFYSRSWATFFVPSAVSIHKPSEKCSRAQIEFRVISHITLWVWHCDWVQLPNASVKGEFLFTHSSLHFFIPTYLWALPPLHHLWCSLYLLWSWFNLLAWQKAFAKVVCQCGSQLAHGEVGADVQDQGVWGNIGDFMINEIPISFIHSSTLSRSPSCSLKHRICCPARN